MTQKLIEVIQAPAALCSQSTLAAAALATQALANVVIDGRSHPLSEFFLTVGESGERKTAVDRCALWPHRQRERTLYEAYDIDYIAYQNDADAYRKAREEALRKHKGHHDKRAALAALGPPPLPPLLPLLVMEEPTYEGLVKLLLVGQPSIGLFTDEGGRLLSGHAMNQDNQLKTAAGLSELWDGKRISRVRSGEGSVVLYGRRVSMHVMAQPTVAQRMLGNHQLLDQGLMSRCLTAWPASTAGSRFYKEVDLSQDSHVQRYNACLLTILKMPLPLAPDTSNQLEPREISLSSQGKQLWVAFHNHVEKQLGGEGPLAPIKGFANKAAEHAARLAGVLTLIDNPEAVEIDRDYMGAGIELTQFYLAEALRLFDTADTDPDLLLAEQLLAWAQPYDQIYLRQIYQYGPNRIRDATTAKRLVSILEAHGWLIRIEGGMEIDETHRRDAWKVRHETADTTSKAA
jgi:hypothetical protein